MSVGHFVQGGGATHTRLLSQPTFPVEGEMKRRRLAHHLAPCGRGRHNLAERTQIYLHPAPYGGRPAGASEGGNPARSDYAETHP